MTHSVTTSVWILTIRCSKWKFLRRSRWTKVKALYIMTRHLPFFLIVMHLYLNFAPIKNPNKCQMLINVYSSFSQISIICSECFFMIRTYVLWNNNRIVLVGLLSTAFAMVVTSVSIRFATTATSYFTTSAIPGTPSCPSRSSSVLYFISFIFLFAFQLVLIILTLTRAIQSWRSTKGPLQSILVKHNIFYYVCGLLLSDRQHPRASAISQLPILHCPRNLSGMRPCDPCHAHAPPSLASRPAHAQR
ncbi:uncharacterized protein F5147DRAFT_39830 [Suillus discolor]|uniref:Uncharacterized protein n=1 Tax=Suillus discolor TaxID=1912936 RepID=A0A9P7EU77_9AGAM|nr:uncharacterized protein F5147DRAFT_39830 [Suillus discolor]KAG2089440.1 hypothetical protein F5147DRAFT_39830 [Suillus discolor]